MIVVKTFIIREVNRNSYTTWHWLYRIKLFGEITNAVLKGKEKGPPTMFLCFAICATCVHHLVISSIEGIFVGEALY